MRVTRKFPIHPAHPERNCWGCDKYCAADALACGNGSERTQHPVELFGDDWAHQGLDPFAGVPDVKDERARDDLQLSATPVRRR